MTISSVIVGLLLLVGLIVLNGLFVAAEYALVSLRKSRAEEMVQARQPKAQTILSLKNDIDRSIAGSQLGITLASLAIGWIGGDALLEVVRYILGFAPNVGWIPSAGLAVAMSFLLLSFIHVVFGEQVPKQIALRLPERTVILLCVPFRLFCLMMFPVIWLMSFVAAATLKFSGVAEIAAAEHPLPSTDEFQIIIEESEKAGSIGKQESHLLQRALELKALTVREVMVPRTRMDCIEDNLSLQQVLSVVCKTKHSKLPVYHVSRDNVIGILGTRDLFDVWASILKVPHPEREKVAASFKLTAQVRRAYFAPESMLASTLLEELKARRLQMAIVVDEFGATVGLVTLEDLLEQLVGEIWDEYDTPHNGVEAIGDGVWHVNGELTLFEFNKALGAEIACALHCTTIAGAVIEVLDRQPRVDDAVVLGGLRFTVLEMRGNAIAKMEVKRLDTQPPATTTDGTTGQGAGPL